jgi:hypothetical protein
MERQREEVRQNIREKVIFRKSLVFAIHSTDKLSKIEIFKLILKVHSRDIIIQ